jgi:predicted acylesterase/phospholipase RssA
MQTAPAKRVVALMRLLLGSALLGGAMLVGGCTHANQPLNDSSVDPESRRHNLTRATLTALADVSPIDAHRGRAVRPTSAAHDPVLNEQDGYFVGLALSGGGSRSANFAAAVMFQLQRIGLLQRVDYISSVSGGSLAGAYYCLNADGPQGWSAARVQRVLTHNFASDVILKAILPWNWFALTFSSWDRSDLLAESFKTHVFSSGGRPQTFADLRPDRPRLLINATDLQSGRRFIFCDQAFDEINSDLAAYPIARAVAASASVPVLMHHVTLRDYSTIFAQYRHLIDGGVIDNLGIVTLVETYDAQVRSALAGGGTHPYPKGAVFLVIDARTRFDAQIADKADIGLLEGLAAGAGLSSTALLNRASSATLAEIIVKGSPDNATAGELRRMIDALEQVGYLSLHDQRGTPVRVVHIALSRLDQVSNVPFESFSEKVNNIATYFNIDGTEAYHLYKAAELLVGEQFEAPLRAIAAELRGPSRAAE